MKLTQSWSPSRLRGLAGALAGVLLVLVAVPLFAQQDEDQSQQQQAAQQQAQPQSGQAQREAGQLRQQPGQGRNEQEAFARRFWQFLQKADYRENWVRWPGQEGLAEGRPAQGAHGYYVKIYLNPKAASSLENPLAESVIVKANYNEDEELVSITPMYRVDAEYDPPNKNWYWARYEPDGTLFEIDGEKLAGRVENCIECHVAAHGDDYVFNNDPVEQ